MTRTFRQAVMLQFMGTVGSGIFVLPYIFYHSNFYFASIFLVFLTFVTGALNLFYCHIVSHTPGDHQLVGYAQIYLGPKFRLVTLFNLLLLAFGAMAVYLKLFASFLSFLLPSLSPYAPIILLIFLGLFFLTKLSASRLNFLIPIFILIIPLVLFISSLTSSLDIRHLALEISPNFLFYGVTLFALSGFTIIPEVDEVLRRGHHRPSETLSMASLLGIILVAFIYFIFSYSVVVLSGSSVTVNTVSGLLNSAPFLAKLIAIFGLFVTFKAALSFLSILHELFFRDLQFSSLQASWLSFGFCVLCYLVSSAPLITIISLTGDVTIFVSALIICLIRLHQPHTFITKFFSLLIMICLFIGFIVTTLV